MNNQESNREQLNVSKARFRSQTFKSNSNNQKLNNDEMSQVLKFDQVNAFICYNCDKTNHIVWLCRVLRKINFNNFVKDIKKNISNQNIDNFEFQRQQLQSSKFGYNDARDYNLQEIIVTNIFQRTFKNWINIKINFQNVKFTYKFHIVIFNLTKKQVFFCNMLFSQRNNVMFSQRNNVVFVMQQRFFRNATLCIFD